MKVLLFKKNIKAFLATFGVHFHTCKWCLICMIQQAYKYVSSSFWPRLKNFVLTIAKILKSSGWELEKSELPWEQYFIVVSVCCRTVNLPSFNGLHCNLATIAHLVCIFYTFF